MVNLGHLRNRVVMASMLLILALDSKASHWKRQESRSRKLAIDAENHFPIGCRTAFIESCSTAQRILCLAGLGECTYVLHRSA